MPKKSKKGKHSHHSHHDHLDVHGPHDGNPDDDHNKLTGEPFPHTSKPKATYVKKDPIKNTPRKG